MDFGPWLSLCVVACLGPVRFAAVLVARLEMALGRCERGLTFRSQNLRGLKSDAKLEELFHSMLVINVYAVCIQEHWRNGHQLLDNRGITVIGAGLTACQQTRRGSQGVGINPSVTATKAWKACGSLEYTNHGARVCAVRFNVKDLTSREEFWFFLVSAYSPIGCAPQTEHADYLYYRYRCECKPWQS